MPPFTMEFESVGNMGWNGDFMLEMSTGIVDVCWKGMSGRDYRKKEGANCLSEISTRIMKSMLEIWSGF